MILRMPIFIAVVPIGPTMILEILACALDAIVIALAFPRPSASLYLAKPEIPGIVAPPESRP
jgi:hypothetical protein